MTGILIAALLILPIDDRVIYCIEYERAWAFWHPRELAVEPLGSCLLRNVVCDE